MLDAFKNTISRLEAFDFGRELEVIVENNKTALANLQAQQWGSTSKDRYNEDIRLEGKGYAPFTIELKEKYGQGLGRVTSRVTLFQTGALYKELFATIKNGQFFIESRVPYFTDLMKRTGEDATGLNDESKKQFAEEITLPQINKSLKEKTGLSIKGRS